MIQARATKASIDNGFEIKVTYYFVDGCKHLFTRTVQRSFVCVRPTWKVILKSDSVITDITMSNIHMNAGNHSFIYSSVLQKQNMKLVWLEKKLIIQKIIKQLINDIKKWSRQYLFSLLSFLEKKLYMLLGCFKT